MDKKEIDRLHSMMYFLEGYCSGKSQKSLINIHDPGLIFKATQTIKALETQVQDLKDRIDTLVNKN